MKSVIRKAKIRDIKQIQGLINFFAKNDLMLPRSVNELFDNIRDYWVAVDSKKIVGCCALHVCWDDLVEIKSLAVQKTRQNKGIGHALVSACLDEARELGARRVFVLTYKADYFRRLGFKRIRHSRLPHKVWAECINCCKFPDCQEVAMIKVI